MIQIKELNEESIGWLNSKGCIVLDTETTGFSRQNDRIIELGALKLSNGKVVAKLDIMMNPEKPIHPRASAVNGITNAMVGNKPTETEYMPKLLEFFGGGQILVGHNAKFDLDFLSAMFARAGYGLNCTYMDTMQLSKSQYPHLKSHKLESLAEHFGLEARGFHRALYDAEVTLKLLRHLAREAKE